MTNEHRVTITLELEHPITPGDIERAYCEIREQVGVDR